MCGRERPPGPERVLRIRAIQINELVLDAAEKPLNVVSDLPEQGDYCDADTRGDESVFDRGRA